MSSQKFFRNVLLATVLSLSGVTASSKYILVSPKQAVPGQDVQFVLHTLKTAEGNPAVNLAVSHSVTGAVYANYTVSRNPNGTTLFSVPVLRTWPSGSYKVAVSALDGTFSGTGDLSVTAKQCAVFIQTDKAIYKPSQTVLFRVIVTNRDMKPYDTKVTIRIQDPNGNRIKQWVNASLVLGMASLDLKLSDKVPLGNWTIFVGAENQEESKIFEVAEYTLPRFQVTVNLPNYVLTNQAKINGYVMAQYTYGENVEGSAVVKFSLGSNIISKTLSVYGRAAFELSKSDLDVLGLSNGDSQSLTAFAEVTESLTGITLNGSASCPISTSDAVVTFMAATSDYFKPGGNFTAYVQVLRPDNTPLTEAGYDVGLSIGYYENFDHMSKVVAVGSLPPSGILPLTFAVPDGQFSFELTATVHLREARITAVKWLSKFNTMRDSSISLSLSNWSAKSYQISDVVSFFVSFRQPPSYWFFVTAARGRILSSTMLNTSVTTFSVSLSASHAPQMTVVAYMVGGAPEELVADSITISIDGPLFGKVNVDYKNDQGQSISQVKPGENVTLSVESSPNSMVGLLAVDTSVLLLKGGNDLTNSKVLSELQNIDNNDEDSTMPFDLGFLWPRMGGDDSAKMFANARLNVITDADMYQTRTWDVDHEVLEDDGDAVFLAAVPELNVDILEKTPSVASTTGASMTPRTRSYFPETWIWTSVMLNNQGKGNVTQAAPDSITSWMTTALRISAEDGLVVTNEALKLKVFQDFFVSAILPYSVVRGEEVALRVVTFNYAADEQRVAVTLLQSAFFTARLNGTDTVFTSQNLTSELKVSGNSGRTTIFWINPRVLGSIKLTILALTPNGGDVVMNDLLVKPEGMEQGYCLSEFVSLQGSDHSASMNVQYPPNVVADSRRVEIQVSGDIMGASIKGLDKLVQVPYGCGEQNMITFTPNIFVRRYLDATGQIDPALNSRTQNNMLLGYQRELTYRRKDHDFSAFGDSDASGSTWLTAFVLKSFRQAMPYLGDSIDKNILESTKTRLLSKQDASGKFVETGRVIHTDMQGGSGAAEALNAYILIALLEDNAAEVDSLRSSTAKTIALLEKSLSSMSSDPYRLAVTTYALTLANSSLSPAALSILESLAHNKDGMLYWKSSDEITTIECHYCPKASATSAIEMSSYALLTYVVKGNLVKASQLAKWLASQRNSLGGFSSTQDTVLALQALAAFARVARPVDFNLDLSFSADGGNSFPAIKLNAENALLLQTSVAARPDNLTRVGFTASGRGSAIVSVCVSYYSLTTHSKPLVDLSVTMTTPYVDAHTTTLHACASSVSSSKSSNGMGIIKVHLPSGFTAEIDSIKGPDSLRRIDKEDSLGELALYFDEFPASSKVCVAVPIQASYMVNMVKDAHVEAYHYYMPEQAAAVAYNPVTGDVSIATTAVPNGGSASVHCSALLVLLFYLSAVRHSVTTS